MRSEGEFDGRMIIDGKVVAQRIGMFISEGDASFRGVERKSGPFRDLSIYPFSKLMLCNLIPKRLGDGYFFEWRGSEFGSWMYGPLGHPGDGEFEIRPLRLLRLEVKYLADRIEAGLSGETDSGTSPYDSKAVLDPWKFSVQFAIPQSDVVSVFGIDDSLRSHVDALFASLGR